jgi:hypothetical protein
VRPQRRVRPGTTFPQKPANFAGSGDTAING